MGQGYNFKCKDCGFSTSASLGIGFLYPNVCDEILGKMKAGDFGEEIKEAANTIPGVAVHNKSAVFICDKCRSWRVDDLIELCVPIKDVNTENRRFSVANEAANLVTYVMDCDVGDTFEVLHRVEHTCNCCNNKMRPVKESRISLLKLKCPKCQKKIDIGESYCWD